MQTHTIGSTPKHVSRPACTSCGGTGFVYLWSTDRRGARVWFCDRGACKRFWSDEGSALPSVANGAAAFNERPLPALSPVAPVLQPA